MFLLHSLVFVAAFAANVIAAEKNNEANPRNVRAAVERSLPFIERNGTAWMEERNCNSCHAVTFLVWSHNAALARGLKVDRKKLAEWVDWSLADSLAEKHRFKLRPRAIAALKAGGLAEPLLAKLKPLSGTTYQTEKEFLDALEKVLGKSDLENHKDQLIRFGTLPNDGGGPDTLAQLLLGRAALPEEKSTTKSYSAVRALLLEWQELNGSWLAAGQLPSMKWQDEKEMHGATTMWSVLALSANKSKDEAVSASRRRAMEFLKEMEPGITLQSVALHLIVADKFGESSRAKVFRQKLLQRQNADGGWSWLRTNQTSDAFATGQALYALGQTGNRKNPAVQRAWKFLLQTQDADGGWDVPQNAINTRQRKLNVYPLWGTAWAAIGMLETSSKDDSQPAAMRPKTSIYGGGNKATNSSLRW
jgi:hypothetical protein